MVNSMFNEHEDKIIEWCMQGVPTREMVEMLGGYYTVAGLNYYIRAHKLREKGAVYKARNHCDECEYCHRYKSVEGKYCKYSRICSLSWRVIQQSVVHCPRWCEKERKYDNTETLRRTDSRDTNRDTERATAGDH